MPERMNAVLRPDDVERLVELFAYDDVARIRFLLRQLLGRGPCTEVIAPVRGELSDEVPVRDGLDTVNAVAIDVKIAEPTFEGCALQLPRGNKRRISAGDWVVGGRRFHVPEQSAAEVLTRVPFAVVRRS